MTWSAFHSDIIGRCPINVKGRGKNCLIGKKDFKTCLFSTVEKQFTVRAHNRNNRSKYFKIADGNGFLSRILFSMKPSRTLRIEL